MAKRVERNNPDIDQEILGLENENRKLKNILTSKNQPDSYKAHRLQILKRENSALKKKIGKAPKTE